MIYPKDQEERKRSKSLSVDTETLTKIVNDYNNDAPIKEMANKYHYSAKTIRKYITIQTEHPMNGVPLPKPEQERTSPYRTSEKVKDEICVMYNNDIPIKEIMEQTKLSSSTILKVIKTRRQMLKKEENKNYVAPNADEFVEYLFAKDTERNYTMKDARKHYNYVNDNYITNWKKYIDNLTEKAKTEREM